MKTRIGFVSNSSSSSFIVNIKDLTDEQIHKIQRATGFNTRLKWPFIFGYSYMDNINIENYLLNLGISIYDIDVSTHIGKTKLNFFKLLTEEGIYDN
jgi:hypothetical protein